VHEEPYNRNTEGESSTLYDFDARYDFSGDDIDFSLLSINDNDEDKN